MLLSSREGDKGTVVRVTGGVVDWREEEEVGVNEGGVREGGVREGGVSEGGVMGGVSEGEELEGVVVVDGGVGG